MPYAYLAFGRVAHERVAISCMGDEEIVLKSKSERVLAERQERLRSDHALAVSRVQLAREEWLRNCWVKEGVSEHEGGVHPTGTRGSYDEVMMDGLVSKARLGTGLSQLHAEADKRFPAPAKPRDPTSRSAGHVYLWSMTTFGAIERQELSMPEDCSYAFGAPMQWITQVLNEYEQQGWSLVQVTEDHGLYRREDGLNEAYLNRIRYLLHRAP